MISQTEVIAALGLGLAGAGHRLGMCGGIAAAINLGNAKSTATTFAYHSGRLTSYAALGALLGYVAGSINLAQWTMGLRYVAGFLLIAMGLSIADWWRGISVLEKAGGYVWKPVQRLTAKLLPVRHAYQGYLLGLGWGLMPCGLIYSALAWSATAGNAIDSGLLMLLFGAGTLPAMLTTSFSAAGFQSLLRHRAMKLVIALFLIASGAWTLIMTYNHGSHLNRAITPGAPAMEHGQQPMSGDHNHR